RDQTAQGERRQERAECVGEDRPGPRDDDEAQANSARGGLPQLLADEDPLVGALGELADVRCGGLRHDRTDEPSVAIDRHTSRRRRDEKSRVRGMRLFGESIDDLAGLLSGTHPRLDRGEEWRREFLEMDARLVILVAEEKTRDRDRGDPEAEEDNSEI